ncbi:hypothetical protein JIN85_08950 [Luteolibacter pohnpeiensis]|uniref:Uncharacterized protein n=1 Tax=Luteolibacter pohnpeiensis TaxID=454153 RepID=A0A934S5B8_9BACT|nr:hypothetical protein [Luteolibacter pohnpeiensis]MBK1882542.1 hypothetical protein [Luteolibacter pohnpeiensis]
MKIAFVVFFIVSGAILCGIQHARHARFCHELDKYRKHDKLRSREVRIERKNPKNPKNLVNPIDAAERIGIIMEFVKRRQLESGPRSNDDQRALAELNQASQNADMDTEEVLELIPSLNVNQMKELLQLLIHDSSLDEEMRGNLVSNFMEWYSREHPIDAVNIVAEIPDLPEREKIAGHVFHDWFLTNPIALKKWYEQQSRIENPICGNPRIFKVYAEVLALTDPEKLFNNDNLDKWTQSYSSFELSNHYFDTFGRQVANDLRNETEHLAFWNALTNAQSRVSNQHSAYLDMIRKDYLSAVANSIPSWTFDDGRSLMESGLTQDEQTAIVANLIQCPQILETERWATWLTSLPLTPGMAHPLEQFVVRWSPTDPYVASEWLDTVQDSDLRTALIKQFVFSAAHLAPDEAISKIATLPDGETRAALEERMNYLLRK